MAIGDREAALDQGFTRIADVRELQDGRVVLLDADDRLVYLATAGLGEVRQIGRAGEGPGEYRIPVRLFALRGDTTAVLDILNGRLLTISPAGEAGDVLGIGSGTAQRPPTRPAASDLANHFYGRISPVRVAADGSQQITDSAAILRWRLGGNPDTVAFIAVDKDDYRIQGRGIQSSAITPFEPRSGWAVSPDGWIAVAYPDPYHVVFVGPDDSTQEGRLIPYQKLKVTEAHRQAYRETAERPRPMLSGPARGSGSGAVRMVRRPFREPSEWPEHLPPFLSNATLQFDPDGNLWIERTTRAEDPPTYDVVARDGNVHAQVMLPAGRRLVAFGGQTLYAVRRDELDLEYLERYRRPQVR